MKDGTLIDHSSEAVIKELHLRFAEVPDRVDYFKTFNTLPLLE